MVEYKLLQLGISQPIVADYSMAANFIHVTDISWNGWLEYTFPILFSLAQVLQFI